MRREWAIALLAAAGVVLGIAAEAASDSGVGPSAADLVTGWTLLACGLWGWRLRPGERRWPLLAAAGIAWFAGNFADTAPAVASSIGAALIHLHRGLLVHAVVAGTGARSWLAIAAVGAGYADVLADGATTVGVAVLLASLAVQRVVARRARVTHTDPLVLGSLLALTAALAVAGVTALAGVSADEAGATVYAYEIALCLAAVMLVAVPTRRLRTRALLADLVVELGPARRSPTVRDALAHALGDPSLAIGYWLPAAGRYLDLDGRPVELPSASSGRAATIVERNGERIAALVHDAAVLDDPPLVDAVQEAAALVLANARLQAEVGAQLAALRASRQRLLEARDQQRRRLARRLHEGAERRLGEVAEAVRAAHAEAVPAAPQLELLDLIERELAQARDGLGELGRGIHPRVLTDRGLAAALAALAERTPVPVELVTPAARLPTPIEAAAYFVCSEALANIAKYARASQVRCEVTRRDGWVSVAVADDGVGGADPARGSGLRGLSDRIEALGGRLRVTSPRGQGTTVRAELPLDRPS